MQPASGDAVAASRATASKSGRPKKAAKEAFAPPVAHSRLSCSHNMYRGVCRAPEAFFEVRQAVAQRFTEGRLARHENGGAGLDG